MRHLLPRTSIVTIVMVVSVSVLVVSVLFVPNFLAERRIRTAPVETRIRFDDNGRVTTNQLIYSAGRYGVAEFGHLRLAFRGRTFAEKYEGGLVLSTDGIGGGTVTASLGENIYTQLGVQGGVSCDFAGIPFEIASNTLLVGGKQFMADGPQRLIIIDKKGRVESSEAIPVSKEEP